MDAGLITAVVLTRDEERNLPRALTSLPRGIGLFVLDAGSRDHTVQFARAAGARVEQREWTDFVEARRYALSQVATPWALMIDADEALDDVLCDAILNAPAGVDGYRLRRTTYFCGKPMRLWRNESLLRLFRTDRVELEAHPAAASGASLHEGWSSDGTIGELPGTLLHYSYPDVATYRRKFDRYTSIEAESMPGSI
ncbi:MAG: glycosyltransferase family 2 protein, partial [Candidatus Baltobacteraceae bacterium]